MKKVGLIGGGFLHAYSSTFWKKPKYFEWSKNNVEDITFFVDEGIQMGINTKCDKKFAWILESRRIIPNVINFVKNNWKEVSESYELVITHNKDLYNLADNFVYMPPHGYWIEQPQLYTKTKLISLLSSSKNYSHRLEWINKLKPHLDLYGMGYKDVDRKEQALQDYMFSVVIENDVYETYWSEKILDCFCCGTVPVYLGAPDIGDYFNADGIIRLTDDFDIKSLSPELYFSMKDAIVDNMNRALEYDVIEDLMWNKFIKRNFND